MAPASGSVLVNAAKEENVRFWPNPARRGFFSADRFSRSEDDDGHSRETHGNADPIAG